MTHNDTLRERIVKIVDYGDEDSTYVTELVDLIRQENVRVLERAKELEMNDGAGGKIKIMSPVHNWIIDDFIKELGGE